MFELAVVPPSTFTSVMREADSFSPIPLQKASASAGLNVFSVTMPTVLPRPVMPAL